MVETEKGGVASHRAVPISAVRVCLVADRGLALVLPGTDKRIDDTDTVEFALSLHVF